MAEEKRPEWMSSISATVDPNDYLLGRKIDKTFELSKQEKAEQAKEARLSLLASDKLKLTGDPILDLERKKEQRKIEIISNPIRLRQFRERILREEQKKQGSSQIVSHQSDYKPQRSRSPTRINERDRYHDERRGSRHRRRSHDRRRETSSESSSSSSSSSSTSSSSSGSSTSSSSKDSSGSSGSDTSTSRSSTRSRSPRSTSRATESSRRYRERDQAHHSRQRRPEERRYKTDRDRSPRTYRRTHTSSRHSPRARLDRDTKDGYSRRSDSKSGRSYHRGSDHRDKTR